FAMLEKTPRTVRLHAHDNVVICIDRAPAGALVGGMTVREPVPRGHKMATAPIPRGGAVRKFGQIIGFAGSHIVPGAHVHEHNCAMGEFARDYAFATENRWSAPSLEGLPTSFRGYRRANGRTGTRNFIAVLTSVNCSASVARFVARSAAES